MQRFDVIVIGGGMAGVAAAMFLKSYGGPAIRALTTASRAFDLRPAGGRLEPAA